MGAVRMGMQQLIILIRELWTQPNERNLNIFECITHRERFDGCLHDYVIETPKEPCPSLALFCGEVLQQTISGSF